MMIIVLIMKLLMMVIVMIMIMKKGYHTRNPSSTYTVPNTSMHS